MSSTLDIAPILQKAQPTIPTASPTATLVDLALFALLSAARRLGVNFFLYTSSPSVPHNGISNLTLGTKALPNLPSPQQPFPYASTKGVTALLSMDAAVRADVVAEVFLIANDELMRFWDFVWALGAALAYMTDAGAV
ncbi:hypothetical protein MMC17_005096 [Xylographa soralifera]|nr:hypothetical protein [Xylographa soralifera]